MNERILKLAEQAELYFDLNGKTFARAMSAEECEKAYEKFAELIVQKCIDICIGKIDLLDSNKNEIWRGALACASDIKEHFGVT